MSEEWKKSITERYGGSDLLNTLINRLGGSARSEVIFGNPVERDGVTVIPVARVRYGVGFGFGTGSGQDSASTGEGGGGGGGGGVLGDPIGYIEICKGGSRFVPITPANPAALMILGTTLVAALAWIFVPRKRAD